MACRGFEYWLPLARTMKITDGSTSLLRDITQGQAEPQVERPAGQRNNIGAPTEYLCTRNCAMKCLLLLLLLLLMLPLLLLLLPLLHLLQATVRSSGDAPMVPQSW